MTLRDLLLILEELISDGSASDQIEVVATAADGETYTPVISIGTDRDGVRRLRLA